MRERTRRRSATLVGLVALVAVLLPVPATAATGAEAPSSAARAPGDVGVDVVAIGPDVLAPGETLAVTVVVRNEGTEPLAAPLVRLKLAPRLLASRDAVDDWATAPDDDFSGSRVAEVPLPDGIGPGGQVTVPLTVPADDLPLPGAATGWGPRGIAVAVLDADFVQVALTRTHVVWFPGRSFSSPVRTSVLVPLTGGAPDVATGLVPPEDLEELTADDGRLAAVLAAASAPGVSWALDPALLASAAALDPGVPDALAAPPTDPTPPTDSAPPAPTTPSPTEPSPPERPTPSPTVPPVPGATTWLGQLRAAAADREVVALPYADPDVTALAHAGEGDLHGLAEEQGRDTVQELLGEPARTDIAWPAGGSVDAGTLQVLSGDGRSAVVLSEGAQPLVEVLDFTPTGRSSLTADGAPVAGLLVDTSLSRTLASTGQGVGGARTPQSTTDDLLAVQHLLAETAAITMERPSVDRHVLVTAPRDWDPDAQTGARALAALTAVPWVEPTSLGSLVDSPAPDVDRAPLAADPADVADDLPADVLRAVGSALETTRQLAPALTRPEDLLAAAEHSAVAATSVAWRDDLSAWTDQVQTFVASSSALVQGIQVVQGSDINVLSARADLPLTVTNSLDQDVQVTVQLNPGSARLVAEEVVPVTVPAGGQERVAVPVRAIASGDTEVSVQLRTPDGEDLGEPVLIMVRVRADWENRGTLGLAVVAGLVLVVGLVRTIRRGRRTASDPLAGSQPREDGS